MRSPPDPFRPQSETLDPGDFLYRVHSNTRTSAEFNPGSGRRTRFAFFSATAAEGAPTVPVLYGGSSADVAVCETLLHDIPLTGGRLVPRDYREKVMSRLSPTRRLVLARFRGTGLRAVGAEASDISDTEADAYERTVRWVIAAHDNGYDGCVWTSRRCNDGAAYVLFGDRVARGDLTQDDGFGRAFALPEDIGWLRDFCSPLGVAVTA